MRKKVLPGNVSLDVIVVAVGNRTFPEGPKKCPKREGAVGNRVFLDRDPQGKTTLAVVADY